MKLTLKSLIEYCEKYRFETRFIIIPNNSRKHKILMKELDNRNIPYSLDKTNNPQERVEGCYVIDFRNIELIH